MVNHAQHVVLTGLSAKYDEGSLRETNCGQGGRGGEREREREREREKERGRERVRERGRVRESDRVR